MALVCALRSLDLLVGSRCWLKAQACPIHMFWFAPCSQVPLASAPCEQQGCLWLCWQRLASPHIEHLSPAPELWMLKSLLPQKLQSSLGQWVSLWVLGAVPCTGRVGGVPGPVPVWDKSAQFGFGAIHRQSRQQGGCCAHGTAVLVRGPVPWEDTCGLDHGIGALNCSWCSASADDFSPCFGLQDDMTDSLRDYTNLPEAAPLLTILDMSARAKYVMDVEEITPEIVEAFVSDFLADKLKPEPI